MEADPKELKMWLEIGLVIGAFLSGIVIAWFPKFAKCRKQKKSDSRTKRYETLHTRIHEELSELRSLGDCARTWCASFHNGEEFFDGTPIRKWSITHESTQLGIRQSQEDTQGILASRFPEMIQYLRDDNPEIIITTELPDDNSLKSFMQARNVTGFVLTPMMDSKGMKLFGFIVCEWCSLTHLDRVNGDGCVPPPSSPSIKQRLLINLKESRNVIQNFLHSGERGI